MYLQGELEHKRGKRFFPFAKTTNHRGAIASHTQRQRTLHSMFVREQNRRLRTAAHEEHALSTVTTVGKRHGRRRHQRPLDSIFAGKERERLLPMAFAAHHQMSNGRRHYKTLEEYLEQFGDDPAFKIC